MKKNVVLAMVAIMGLSLSACGNKVEETANIETVETVSNEETTSVMETASTVEASSETESLESQELSNINDESVATSGETITSPTEPSVEQTTEPTTSNTNSTFDVNPDGSLSYEDLQHRWTTGTTWKASNGVELKINDAWADAVKAGDLGSTAAIWYEDPDRDPTPNSPYMVALDEFIYGTDEAYLNGKDRVNPEVVDISKLPDIPLASSKQTSVIETDESRAYKEAYDTMYGFQVTGKWEANPAYLLQFGFDGGKGIGLTAMGQGYLWELEYNGSEWVVTIRTNLSELQWDGLHNSLRLVSPDGDLLYQEIYDAFYTGNTTYLNDYDTWTPINNSEILIVGGESKGYSQLKFR